MSEQNTSATNHDAALEPAQMQAIIAPPTGDRELTDDELDKVSGGCASTAGPRRQKLPPVDEAPSIIDRPLFR